MQQFVYTNEGKVLLREAKEADIPKIYEMYQDYNPHAWWQSEDLTCFRYHLIKEAKGKIFVAILDDKVIGHAEIVLPDDKKEPVYLVRLEVHDDYRRRKFGIEMVRYSAIIMKNLGYEEYATWPAVDKSKGLYKKVGLKEKYRLPQLTVNITDQRPIDYDLQQELTVDERPADLEVAVGCPWGRHFTWLKAFKAGAEEKLNYQGPYAQQVEIAGITGAVLVDGANLFVYLPEGNQEAPEVIEKFIVYGSNLAREQGITTLHINVLSEIWEEFDLSDIWEVAAEEERLNMRMQF